MHFESMAADYATARPPYPPALFQRLRTDGVIGPGKRVLEVGAGTGLATREVAATGAEVVALEPGRELATLLAKEIEGVSVIIDTLERAALPNGSFHSVLAATSMHWVDLSIALPKLHAALRPSGRLAVWRHQFRDDNAAVTPFRQRVQAIARARPTPQVEPTRPNKSTMEELSAGGWFTPVRTEQWRWSIALDTDKVTRLFRTFPEWTDAEVEAVSSAAEDLGGVVIEHYQTILHLLRRADRH